MRNLLALIFLVPVVGFAQNRGANQYEPTVRAFLETIGREYTVRSLEFSNTGKSVRAYGENYWLSVDVEENVVRTWSDGRPEISRKKDDGNGPVIRSEADARRVAEEWLEMAGFDIPLFDHFGPRTEAGTLYMYNVVYKDAPHGYEGGVTDGVTVSVNCFSGEVTHASRRIGHQYDEPDIRITEEQARQIFIDRVAEVIGVELFNVEVVQLQYASVRGRGEMWDSSRAPKRDNQRVSLAYRVQGQYAERGNARNLNAMINAKTGAVMGGGLAKDSSPLPEGMEVSSDPGPVESTEDEKPDDQTTKADKSSEPDKGSSTATVVLIVGVVALGGYGLLKLFKK